MAARRVGGLDENAWQVEPLVHVRLLLHHRTQQDAPSQGEEVVAS